MGGDGVGVSKSTRVSAYRAWVVSMQHFKSMTHHSYSPSQLNIYFSALGDFQYMPVDRDGPSDSPLKCILEDILPSGLDTPSFLS